MESASSSSSLQEISNSSGLSSLLIGIIVASVVCFLLAVIGGVLAFYILHRRQRGHVVPVVRSEFESHGSESTGDAGGRPARSRHGTEAHLESQSSDNEYPSQLTYSSNGNKMELPHYASSPSKKPVFKAGPSHVVYRSQTLTYVSADNRPQATPNPMYHLPEAAPHGGTAPLQMNYEATVSPYAQHSNTWASSDSVIAAPCSQPVQQISVVPQQIPYGTVPQIAVAACPQPAAPSTHNVQNIRSATASPALRKHSAQQSSSDSTARSGQSSSDSTARSGQSSSDSTERSGQSSSDSTERSGQQTASGRPSSSNRSCDVSNKALSESKVISTPQKPHSVSLLQRLQGLFGSRASSDDDESTVSDSV